MKKILVIFALLAVSFASVNIRIEYVEKGVIQRLFLFLISLKHKS